MQVTSVSYSGVGKIWRLASSRLSRASVYAFSTLAGVLVATRGGAAISVLALAPLATFLISLGIYLLNDLFDTGADRINAPTRPIASKIVSKRAAALFVLCLSVLGAAIGFYLGRVPFLISLFEIFLGVCYSVRPFNFKDKFILKTLCIGVGGVSASIFGGAAAGIINADLIFSSAMFLVFLFSTSPLNDLADYDGDKAEHRKTIPIVIGPARTLRLSMIASIAPLVSYLILFSSLSFNPLSIICLALVAARAMQLLLPLAKTNANVTSVRKSHKQMVYLHYLLQGGLMLGSLPL